MQILFSGISLAHRSPSLFSFTPSFDWYLVIYIAVVKPQLFNLWLDMSWNNYNWWKDNRLVPSDEINEYYYQYMTTEKHYSHQLIGLYQCDRMFEDQQNKENHVVSGLVRKT